MPELPEVEAARRAVEEHCVGKKIVKAIIADDPKVIHAVSSKDFEASLVGKTIVGAYRKGKNMWLQLDSPPFPTFQFGMAGAIYIKGVAITKYKRAAVNDTDEWPSKYSKFFVELNDGLELSFTDKRRFAKVRLLDNPVSVPPVSELGPDALLEPMTVDRFYSSLMKKNIGIKALLLDQSFISGIGNWMADEVLYQARIHPLQGASSMSKQSCETLLKCLNEVIEKAVEVGADSSQFPSNWIFHYREKKPGQASVDGKKIEFINAGGRTTAYVPELQKLIGTQSAKTGGRTRKDTKIGKGNAEDDLDEPGSEEEVTAKGKDKKSAAIKKLPTKRKSKGSNIESDENDNDEENLKGTRESMNPRARKKPVKNSNRDAGGSTKNTRGKNTPARRKSKGSESDPDDASIDDDDDDDSDNEDQNRTNVKPSKTKIVKTSKKKAESSLRLRR